MKVLLISSVFHIHLSVMCCTAFTVYIASVIGRFILMLFELHIILPSEDSRGIDDTLLVAASFLRVYCTFYLTFGLLGFTLERLCATYWCDDYERRTRWWIIPLISSIAFFGGFYLTYCLLFDLITWLPLVAIIGTINTVGLVSFLLLHRHNLKKYAKMRQFKAVKLTGYELSKRYQLLENIRVSQLLYKMTFPIFINYLIICGFYFAHLLCVFPYISIISLCLYDLWIAVFACSVPIMGYVIEPAWRVTTRKLTMRSKIGIYVPPPKVDRSRDVDIHFTQLQIFWS